MPKSFDYIVLPCKRNEIKAFVEKWHYSHNINGLMSRYCFKLMNGKEMVGAMIYGGLGMANCWKKYVDRKEDIIELRRLCCIDDTPKNTESYFIGKTLKWLIANTGIKKVISYADNTYNHTGIIYQASNFTHLGKTPKGRVILYDGKRFHDKAIRTKFKGKLKPFAKELKEALDTGKACYEETLGKEIYLYDLEERRSKRRKRTEPKRLNFGNYSQTTV